jgi:hypothetical protein
VLVVTPRQFGDRLAGAARLVVAHRLRSSYPRRVRPGVTEPLSASSSQTQASMADSLKRR